MGGVVFKALGPSEHGPTSDHPMRNARAVLEDLVLHVQPPKGYAIVLTERPIGKPSDPNWVATVGPMGLEYTRLYTAKVAELRKIDVRVDWSEVTSADGPRRLALRHSELRPMGLSADMHS